jgi:small subunit ribosomal protein S21
MAVNLTVYVPGGNVERALGLMKKSMLKDGLFKEMKMRAYYEKPSVKRKRKHNEALRSLRKKEKKTREAEARFDRKPEWTTRPRYQPQPDEQPYDAQAVLVD